jgi:hypothetical protein
MKTGSETLHLEIHEIGIWKNCYRIGTDLLVYLFTKWAIKLGVDLSRLTP